MLELSNGGKLPVALYPYMIIATVTFETIDSAVQQPYYKQSNPKYLDTTGISSKLADDPDMITISKMYKITKKVFEDSNL